MVGILFLHLSGKRVRGVPKKHYVCGKIMTNTMPTKSTTLVLFNSLGLVAVLVTNYLANALPIAGRTPAEVSDLFPTLFTPAGFTFGIWGLIYLLLLAFVVYQVRFWGKPTPVFMQKIGWLFALSCVANAAWLPAFHSLQIGLAMFIMLLLLGSLVLIYLRLDIGRAVVPRAERWLVHLPFSVYLGWITVATIANASILLTHLGWNGEPGGAQFWTLLVMAAAVAIALWATFGREDFAYALVILWALFGIYSKRMADFGTVDGLVETAAVAGMGLVGIGVVYRAFRRK